MKRNLETYKQRKDEKKSKDMQRRLERRVKQQSILFSFREVEQEQELISK